jgi:DNA-3-methyladenine glycosylase
MKRVNLLPLPNKPDTLSAESARCLERLSKAFYSRRALSVAPDLLGKVLVHDSKEGLAAGIITETEAYEGPEDRACHAFGGRRTPRNEPLYGPPGIAYVYFTYGMHFLFNAVTAEEGTPHAVLVRSVLPVSGLELMSKRRNGREPLSSGPGRLCQAMGILRVENGADLQAGPLYIAYPPEALFAGLFAGYSIRTTPRLGVDYSGEAKDYPWRFLLVKT